MHGGAAVRAGCRLRQPGAAQWPPWRSYLHHLVPAWIFTPRPGGVLKNSNLVEFFYCKCRRVLFHSNRDLE